MCISGPSPAVDRLRSSSQTSRFASANLGWRLARRSPAASLQLFPQDLHIPQLPWGSCAPSSPVAMPKDPQGSLPEAGLDARNLARVQLRRQTEAVSARVPRPSSACSVATGQHRSFELSFKWLGHSGLIFEQRKSFHVGRKGTQVSVENYDKSWQYNNENLPYTNPFWSW